MSRVPSVELVRFMLSKWAMSNESLNSVRSQIVGDFSMADGFEGGVPKLVSDLDELINNAEGSATVADTVKPTVVCIFGIGGDGKSTLANLLMKNHGIDVFSTDTFINSLRLDWHDSPTLRSLYSKHSDRHIDQFIKDVQASTELGAKLVELFFRPDGGFSLLKPVSIIEGFLRHPEHDVHFDIEQHVIDELHRRKYRVWEVRSRKSSRELQ